MKPPMNSKFFGENAMQARLKFRSAWVLAVITTGLLAAEARAQTENAFGMTWTVAEPPHRGVGPGLGVVTGMPNSLTLQGVWGADTNAIAPISVAPGVKVKY